MKVLESRLIIRPSDLIAIFGGNYEANRRRLRTIKDAIGKEKITFKEFATYEGLNYTEVCEICGVKPLLFPTFPY